MSAEIFDHTYETTVPQLDPEAPDNREQLFQTLEARITDTPGNFALVVIDLDGLKDINEGYNHQEGDRYLENARELLGELIRHPRKGRERDELIVIHINGDEFCVVLGGASSQEDVTGFIHRLQPELSEYGIEASMGGKVHSASDRKLESAGDLYVAADKLMQINDLERKRATFHSLPLEVQEMIVAGVTHLSEVKKLTGLSPRTILSLGIAVLAAETSQEATA